MVDWGKPLKAAPNYARGFFYGAVEDTPVNWDLHWRTQVTRENQLQDHRSPVHFLPSTNKHIENRITPLHHWKMRSLYVRPPSSEQNTDQGVPSQRRKGTTPPHHAQQPLPQPSQQEILQQQQAFDAILEQQQQYQALVGSSPSRTQQRAQLPQPLPDRSFPPAHAQRDCADGNSRLCHPGGGVVGHACGPSGEHSGGGGGGGGGGSGSGSPSRVVVPALPIHKVRAASAEPEYDEEYVQRHQNHSEYPEAHSHTHDAQSYAQQPLEHQQYQQQQQQQQQHQQHQQQQHQQLPQFHQQRQQPPSRSQSLSPTKMIPTGSEYSVPLYRNEHAVTASLPNQFKVPVKPSFEPASTHSPLRHSLNSHPAASRYPSGSELPTLAVKQEKTVPFCPAVIHRKSVLPPRQGFVGGEDFAQIRNRWSGMKH